MNKGISVNYIIGEKEEEFFPYSFKSILSVADEVIIVFNQTDKNTEECVFSTCLGEDVPVQFFYEEERNFALLRNIALSHSTKNWIMKLDADEVFYDDIVEIKTLLDDPEVIGINCWFWHLLKDFEHCHEQSEHDLLYHRLLTFRNVQGVEWRGAVHESIHFPQHVRVGRKLIDADIHYVHYGYVKPQEDIFRRWKLYSDLEGQPDRYENEFKQTGLSPSTILDDRTIAPFMAEHPEIIREYCKAVMKNKIERLSYE